MAPLGENIENFSTILRNWNSLSPIRSDQANAQYNASTEILLRYHQQGKPYINKGTASESELV